MDQHSHVQTRRAIALAGKLLHHQMILQPSAIPAWFSFPMDPPASALPMP